MTDAWSERMRRTWDQLAERNAMHFIATERTDWNRAEFLGSGEQIVSMVDSLAGGEPVGATGGVALDLGCGIGRLSFALANRFDRVIGVDVSEAMVRQGRALAAELDVSNVDFVRSNGRDVSTVPDASCDFALSYVVLQHMPAPAVVLGAIAELGRVLRTGGRAAFQVPVYHRGLIVPAWRLAQHMFRLVLVRAEARGWVTPERGIAFRGTRLTEGQLHRALARARLHLDALERTPSRYRFCDEWFLLATKQ